MGKTNIASILLKIPFPEKSKLSYNKEYGLFGLLAEALTEGRRQKVEGRRQPEQKVESRRQNQNSPARTLSLSDNLGIGHSPPLRSNPLPQHPALCRAISKEGCDLFSVWQNPRQRFKRCTEAGIIPRVSRFKLVDWWSPTSPEYRHKNSQLSSKC